jgi:hypothetical protein
MRSKPRKRVRSYAALKRELDRVVSLYDACNRARLEAIKDSEGFQIENSILKKKIEKLLGS